MKSFIKYFLAFMAVWITGCYLADYVFPEIANSYMMAWGWFVACIGLVIGHFASTEKHERGE